MNDQRDALPTKQTLVSPDHLAMEQRDGGAVAIRLPNRTPALIAQEGRGAQFAWDEFIYGRIRNRCTRKAYAHAVHKFLDHCRASGAALTNIMPRDVGCYLDELPLAPASKKLHLAALRHFFDALVTRHVVVLNPAASVRGERLQLVEGRTPEIGVEHARRLIASIEDSHVVGRRDRAIIGIFIYTAVRVGAVAQLTRGDFYSYADQHYLRFREKGGKSREIPVRHDLQQFLLDYLAAGSLHYTDKSTPLFRTTRGRTRQLTPLAMSADDIARMMKRRLKEAGQSNRLSPHSFRVTTITDLLSQGVPLEDVQHLAGHADPRTTRLYDRRQRTITRNIVERISV